MKYELSGSDGNAFVILGSARMWARQLGMSKPDVDDMINDASSRDYQHLLEVVAETFDNVVQFQFRGYDFDPREEDFETFSNLINMEDDYV